jgi:hypothetical protein
MGEKRLKTAPGTDPRQLEVRFGENGQHSTRTEIFFRKVGLRGLSYISVSLDLHQLFFPIAVR